MLRYHNLQVDASGREMKRILVSIEERDAVDMVHA